MNLPELLVHFWHFSIQLLATAMLNVLRVRDLFGKQAIHLTSLLELEKLF